MEPGRQSEILEFIRENPGLSSKEIQERSGIEIGYATVKRILNQLIEQKIVVTQGKGKGTKYLLSPGWEVLQNIDLEDYYKQEIDDRKIKPGFNFQLIPEILSQIDLFSSAELEHLARLQGVFQSNTATLSDYQYRAEMERLAIDFSWKSSQIEGNTYSLLETERLLREKETANGKTKEEAIMLLNHKDALDFILENPGYVSPITVSGIEDLHSILVKDLGVGRNIRQRRVRITGTNYLPIDNEFQIREALRDMCNLVNQRENVFEKALLLLVLLSYIQAFEDGNKRTTRLISNAMLINYNYCPISFRTVDSIDYKKAMLLFYEQNNISAFKRIFMEQFEFAVNTYF
ncbi:MAG: Fic family protein [Bacteroidia bacterium]|nr:Fic family protein [Bacteroidia bacterium]